jgi:hypothetical protein
MTFCVLCCELTIKFLQSLLQTKQNWLLLSVVCFFASKVDIESLQGNLSVFLSFLL